MNIEKKLKGVFIPFEVLQMDLKADEKIVLSIIAYYTEQGNKNACYLTNKQLSEISGVSYFAIRDRIKPTLIEKGLIQTNGGIKSVSTLNLYRENTIVDNNPSLNNDTVFVSSNHDSNLYRENTMGGCSENTIQNKERKIKENKEIKKESDLSKTYNTPCDGKPVNCSLDGEKTVNTPNAEKPNAPTVLQQLCWNYRYDGDTLPLLQYLQEHPTKEVYTRIENEFDESEQEGLKTFARNIDFDMEQTPSDDWLLNDDTPSPKQIAEAKKQRVERLTKRFFAAMQKHINEGSTPSQTDINKFAERLDEIECPEARQLKTIMNDVLNEHFNGVSVYPNKEIKTPSTVYTLPTPTANTGNNNSLPY